MCDEIRTWTFDIVRNVRRIASYLKEMKPIYERMTDTGWGKRRRSADVHSFDEEVAQRTGVDRSLIRRYCRIAQLDQRTRDRIEGRQDIEGNMTLLYRLVQADEETRHRALDVYDKEGRAAMREVLRRPRAARSEPKRGLTRTLPAGDHGDFVVDHTFERPALGEWMEHRIDNRWVLRMKIAWVEGSVRAVSVGLVHCPVVRTVGEEIRSAS
jgi:hypothetical protein